MDNSKYRIKRVYSVYGVSFIVEKKVWGLFWRTFLKNDHGYAVHFYQFEKAERELQYELEQRSKHGDFYEYDKEGNKCNTLKS